MWWAAAAAQTGTALARTNIRLIKPFERSGIASYDRPERTGNGSDRAIVCGNHFAIPDDFENHMQWQMGFAKNLILKKDVIPAKLPKPSTSGQATASKDAREPALFARKDKRQNKRTADGSSAEGSQRKCGAVHKLTVDRVSVV